MNQGRPDLRQALARRMLEEEPTAGSVRELSARMMITNGSQQALYLAMQVLCNPGDIVLVDRPSYFVFLEMLAGLGVQPLCIPVDAQGVVHTQGLETILDTLGSSGRLGRLKAVYFVSYFSNPSSRSLSEKEKSHIALALHSRGRIVPVVEDAAYRGLYYDQPSPARSILSLPAWEDFPKLYLSTLTKSFATGLKIGYGVCSDTEWLARMLAVKGHHDFGSSNLMQALCERVLMNGGLDMQLLRVRSVYRRKMKVLHHTLEQEGLLSLGWRWSVPSGGLYLWLRAPDGFDTTMESAFCRACLELGVLYVPGDLCYGDNAPKNRVRLSFGVLAEQELQEAGKRFVAAARKVASSMLDP
jgi:2-aminoadipate transaminase